MTLRFPRPGDRPSWIEVVILFALAAAAAAVYWLCFSNEKHGNVHPVLADQVAQVQPME